MQNASEALDSTTEAVRRGDSVTGRALSDGFLRHLVKREKIAETTAERVAKVQEETSDRLAHVLLKLGFLSEREIADEQIAFLGLPPLRGELFPAEAPELPDLNASFLRAKGLILLSVTDGRANVGCWDALDSEAHQGLAYALERPLALYVGLRQELLEALDRLQPEVATDSSETLSESDEREEIDRLKDLASDEPIIRLVQQNIDQAVIAHASDIHFEASELGLKVRFRLDGMLRDYAAYPKSYGSPVISRIKVMAGLNIAEQRLPQDGRLRITVQGKEIDFRVASSPSLHGESLVLRILDRRDVALDFVALGFDMDLASELRAAVTRPHGIVLVTGPTGSGKTTTLYAALKEINSSEKKLLTVEDPVEYQLPGVTQVPVRPQIGLTFAHALRSFLRQDPDVIMVGEIRDQETADIAIQAALTGHLVLTTLHTNTAAGAITRLLDMGIDDFLLTSTLHLVIGQRLVRRLCQRCKKEYSPDAKALERMGTRSTTPWFSAVGCEHCQGTGFLGRTSILEAMPLSESIRAAVLQRKDAPTIETLATAAGMRTMYQHGLQRVANGETTLEEILRVCSAHQ